MPRFSEQSLDRLGTCDPRLYQLFYEVVKDIDCKVICGYRSPEDQERAFQSGYSKLRWPQSKHNKLPKALAVDVCPYPVNWSNHSQFCFLAGWVLRTAKEFAIPIRWGGDWNSNMMTGSPDETFFDLAHYELR